MKTLFEILALRRPHGGNNERYVAEGIIAGRLPGLMVYEDDKGAPMAYTYEVGTGTKTLFCAHLDTVHRDELTPNPVVFDAVKKQAFKVDGTCLGADCGAGVWLIMKMAEAGVPGTYVWTVGEERGGVGARWLADNAEDFLGQFARAVAFDRRGTDSVITHQGWGGRCCSDEFADALSMGLTTLLDFLPDSTGVYTDTAEWTSIIPECTNISVGYLNEHSGNETLDVGFLEALLAQCLIVDWEALPTVRDPLLVEDISADSYSILSPRAGALVDGKEITLADLYGMSVTDIELLMCDQPDEIAALLYREANGGCITDELEVNQWPNLMRGEM